MILGIRSVNITIFSRLGHVNQTVLIIQSKSTMVIKPFQVLSCEHCVTLDQQEFHQAVINYSLFTVDQTLN